MAETETVRAPVLIDAGVIIGALLKGDPLTLGPKVFDLLAYLVRHRCRAVTKQELFDHLCASIIASATPGVWTPGTAPAGITTMLVHVLMLVGTLTSTCTGKRLPSLPWLQGQKWLTW